MTVGGPHISATVKLPSKPTCWDTNNGQFIVDVSGDTIKDYQAFKMVSFFKMGNLRIVNIWISLQWLL